MKPPLLSSVRLKAESFHRENETSLTVLFFLAGVLLDFFTLRRIDSVFGLLQQGSYLLILIFLLNTDARVRNHRLQLTRPWVLKLWDYRFFAVHFLFGSLLSAYTIFYFKSSSHISSFLFLGLLCAVLVSNELKSFRGLGPSVKFSLLALCLSSYLGYLVPVIVGSIGPWIFAASMALTSVAFLAQILWLRKSEVSKRLLWREIAIPAAGVIVIFEILYLLKVIPPVPLSVLQIGIYHGVEKGDGRYTLLHEKPEWKFWQEGDQLFLSREGDRVFCFARIFSPARFKDQIFMHWLVKNAKGRWETWDRIPMEIVGGRELGFRGFSAKANHQPGLWRVQVETTDGREVGRIQFEIQPDSRTEDRIFRRDPV